MLNISITIELVYGGMFISEIVLKIEIKLMGIGVYGECW